MDDDDLTEARKGARTAKDAAAIAWAQDEIERLRRLFHQILMLNVENPYSAQLNEMANALARSALSR
jgi:two-component SAPR family response regulator